LTSPLKKTFAISKFLLGSPGCVLHEQQFFLRCRAVSESRVVPTLVAVKAALAVLTDLAPEKGPSSDTFFAGERLAERTHELLGSSASSRAVALLVTCPTEAAEEPSFMKALAEHGVEAVRINCAHDDADHWQQMIDHVRAAGLKTGLSPPRAGDESATHAAGLRPLISQVKLSG
jgi:hypothetical protein